MIDLGRYKLTSRKHGGQYSGPCWFTGIGDDRFTIEPHPPEGGPPRWFCRNCNQCNKGYGSGGYRYGTIEDQEQAKMVQTKTKTKPTKNTITYDQAVKLSASMNSEGLAYLESRGISTETARRFKLGMVNGRSVTIPLVYHWEERIHCPAIKQRWIPQHHPKNAPKYVVFPGSKTKGVFNFDKLREPGIFGIIANSLFDIMYLDQLGFPVAGPFSGEADWEEKWSEYIQWETIINLGDWDEMKYPQKGTPYRPGTQYMLRRAIILDAAPNVKRIINVYPPNEITDITAMHQEGKDVKKWIVSLLEE
jgi:hypothetical protein